MGPDSNPSESQDRGSLKSTAVFPLAALLLRPVGAGEREPSEASSRSMGIGRVCLLDLVALRVVDREVPETLDVQLSASETSESSICRLADDLVRAVFR